MRSAGPGSTGTSAPWRFTLALANGAALALATGQALALGEALAASAHGVTGFAQLDTAVRAAARGALPYAPAAPPAMPDPLVPPFTLPPAALLIFQPLRLLDPGTARWQWTALQLAALAAALGVLVHQSGVRWPRHLPAVFALLVLLFPPVRAALRVGDVEPFLLLLLVTAWAFGRRGRALRGGLVLGIGAALWPALLAVAVPWLVWREWAGAAAALGTALLLNACALLLLTAPAGAAYLAALADLAPHWLAHAGNVALAGTVRLTTPGPGRSVWLDAPAVGAVLALLSAATVLSTLIWLAKRARAHRDLVWSAALVVALLLGPLATTSSLVLLAMPLVLLSRALPWRIGGAWELLLAALALVVAGPALVQELLTGDRLLAGPLLLLPFLPTLGLVALLGLSAALARKPAVVFARRVRG